MTGYWTDFEVIRTENYLNPPSNNAFELIDGVGYGGNRGLSFNTDVYYFMKHRTLDASQTYGRMEMKVYINNAVNAYRGFLVAPIYSGGDVEYGCGCIIRMNPTWMSVGNMNTDGNFSGTDNVLLATSNLTWYTLEFVWEENGVNIDCTATLYNDTKTSTIGTVSDSYATSTYWRGTDLGILEYGGPATAAYIDDFKYYDSA